MPFARPVTLNVVAAEPVRIGVCAVPPIYGVIAVAGDRASAVGGRRRPRERDGAVAGGSADAGRRTGRGRRPCGRDRGGCGRLGSGPDAVDRGDGERVGGGVRETCGGVGVRRRAGQDRRLRGATDVRRDAVAGDRTSAVGGGHRPRERGGAVAGGSADAGRRAGRGRAAGSGSRHDDVVVVDASVASFQSWSFWKFALRVKSPLTPQAVWVCPFRRICAPPVAVAVYWISTLVQTFAGAEFAPVKISLPVVPWCG